MRQQLNRISTVGLVVLSLGALLPLLVVAVPAMLSGQVQPREQDEGTGAHIFQLSIALLMPAILVFLATANWARPGRVFRALALPACAVACAFGLLYYFEHGVTSA